MINFGPVPTGAVLPVFFGTYGKTNGESITLTDLAVTDIEIYKGISATQRASDNGYTLMDTDGIDVDGITGIHGFSIDTGDDSDSGFYAVGSFFTVVVSAVTVDGQIVNFVAATFRVVAAEHTAGYPVSTIKDGTGTGEIDTTAGGVLVAAIATGGIAAASFAAGAIDAAAIAANAIGASELAADAVTEIQSGLATASALTIAQTSIDDLPTNAELATALGTADDAVLAQVALVKAKTDNLPTDPADQSLIIDATNALATLIGDVPTNAELAVSQAAADDATLAAIAALNNLSAAEVNAEVVDALSVDTYAEPTGVPSTTVSIAEKVGRLYQQQRGGIETDSTEKRFKNNAGTVLWKKAISDDGTTYTEGGAVTP